MLPLAERSPRGGMLRLGHLAKFLHSLFDGGTGIRQVLGGHGRSHLDAGIKGQEPRFSDGRQFGNLFDLKEEVGCTLSVVGQKIRGLRFQVLDNGLDPFA